MKLEVHDVGWVLQCNRRRYEELLAVLSAHTSHFHGFRVLLDLLELQKNLKLKDIQKYVKMEWVPTVGPCYTAQPTQKHRFLSRSAPGRILVVHGRFEAEAYFVHM